MSVPAWLQTLRSLRPTHVMSALPKGSPLLVLSPRDLRRADPAPLPRTVAPALFAVPALLRAARDAGAVLGLVKPGALQGAGPSAPQFASAVFRTADEMGYQGPLFMSTSPIPIPGGEEAGERLRSEVQRYLDAGFTEIVLQLGRTLPENALPTIQMGLAAVRERELPVMLRAERADEASAAIEELQMANIGFDLVALELAEGAGALDAEVELPIAEFKPGIRGVDLSADIQRIAERVLGPRARPDRARELETIDEDTQLRLEALVYAEALGALQKDPIRGAASRVMRALSDRPGY